MASSTGVWRIGRPGSQVHRSVLQTMVAGIAALALAACGATSGAGSKGSDGPVDEAAVKEAKTAIATFADPAADYTGPTSGSKAESGKFIAYVTCAATIVLCNDGAEAVKEAATTLGWDVTVIDGGGTASGWLDGMNKAIALKPDAIMESGISPEAVPEAFKRAKEAGIPVVSTFAAGFPGPIEEAGVFYNEDTDGGDIGEAMAQYAIADSEGTARVVIVYDNAYAIARAKNDAMKKVIEACSSCELLDDISTPFGELSKNIPGLLSGWLSKYGSEPFYILSVGDIVFDNMVPTLTSRGVKPEDVKLIGADGSATAYQRIREGQYQVATVPQPVGEMAYNAVDQVIRALDGQEPFDWSPLPYLVTPDNVDQAGGDENKYEPQNGFAEKYAAIWGTS